MDLDMPHMDGLEAAGRLRRLLGKQVILIAVTGRISSADKAEALAAGYDVHVGKPLDWDAISHYVRDVLRI